MLSIHVQFVCMIEPGAVVLQKRNWQWHNCYTTIVMQHSEKVQNNHENPFDISISMFYFIKNKVKALLYDQKKINLASLMISYVWKTCSKKVIPPVFIELAPIL